MKIRTGYSFRSAVGHLEDVIDRIEEIGLGCAPISDRSSAFGFVRWSKLCKKKGLQPIFGVELAVTDSINAKKPSVDYWSFFARNDIVSINKLIELASNQFRYEPLLTYDQAMAAEDVTIITGNRPKFDCFSPEENLYIPVGPSSMPGMIRKAKEAGHKFMMSSDNKFTRQNDQALYEVICGRDASTQSYPQWILSMDEWLEATDRIEDAVVTEAAENAEDFWGWHKAELKQATLLKPIRDKTLLQMCLEGADSLGIDMTNKVYSDRLERELELIKQKDFEDYFYIIADVVQWARERMIVGPARGSSCGSLACYLLKITTIDPIPYGLIFERFIDINRSDLPDIDIDFSDTRRHLVFEYMEKKYGVERVARLGTVAVYQPRSAIKEAAAALDIPPWETRALIESLIERSSGDARALSSLEDTLDTTPAGLELLAKFPEIRIATKMEGHPRHHSQHAAGIVLTESPVRDYIAIDSRTGATHCDKKDAEELNLLKIDALGLTQLSVFEDIIQSAGLDFGILEKIPLNDPATFDVLNRRQFAGIFQFNGMSLQTLAKQIVFDDVEDIISITALARPGPLASGGATNWVLRKSGKDQITYPHPLFEPYLNQTKGIVLYQEQVMEIGRKIGDLSWEDVSALRKAMSKSLGKEYFDQFGDRFKVGAVAKGIPYDLTIKIWDDMCLSGDTVLVNPHPSKGCYAKMTLKQLYDRGGLGPAGSKRQKLLMWDGESLKPFENWGVSYSGEKQTFTLKTDSGNQIHATEEHKFLQADGSYKLLKDLSVGDFVMSDSGPIPAESKRKKGTGSGGHNWWHKLSEGKPCYQTNRSYLKTMFNNCQVCRDAPYDETHHINMDHEDHRIENLLPVCRKCHKKLHAVHRGSPKAWEIGRGIFPDKIVSIEPRKIEKVYDVHMPAPHHNFLAEGIVVHNCAYGSWAFNRSHSVAYGIISYWCAWFKAHYAMEFAAATLTHESDPEKQIQTLREMASEGIKYRPADKEKSIDRWVAAEIDGEKMLVGPLQNVKGLGPKLVQQVMSSRARGEPLPARADKLLTNPKTPIDSLFPISEAFKTLMPDPSQKQIFSSPKRLIDLQATGQAQENVLVFVMVKKINPRDGNEAVNIAKRGGKRMTGPSDYLNMHITDDSDTMLAKIGRFDYEKLGKPIVDRGKPGKALYAMKGTVMPGFRMIDVKAVRYIGDLE